MNEAIYVIGCLTILAVVVWLLHQLYKLIADDEFCKEAGIITDPCEKCSGEQSECEHGCKKRKEYENEIKQS